MRSGRFYRRRPLVPRTSAKGSSSWPTPSARDHKGGMPEWSDRERDGKPRKLSDRSLPDSVRASEPTGPATRPTTLNPRWVEWLMGLPPGWTEV